MRFAVEVQGRPTALLDPPEESAVTSGWAPGNSRVEDCLGAAKEEYPERDGSRAHCIEGVMEDCGRGAHCLKG